ncbi:MAG: hypothetical protein HUJ54_09930 [Erysipelotrichaceae bacterium]|nr:hypothetical protein [Erysipelotrichaceae bacterium]
MKKNKTFNTFAAAALSAVLTSPFFVSSHILAAQNLTADSPAAEITDHTMPDFSDNRFDEISGDPISNQFRYLNSGVNGYHDLVPGIEEYPELSKLSTRVKIKRACDKIWDTCDKLWYRIKQIFNPS